MRKGTIKRLVSDRGFGFIEEEGNPKDLFFHASALVDVEFDSLREGDNVTFEVEENDKGAHAINVKQA